MTRAEAMMEKQIACGAGGHADQEFARACRKAGITVADALIGSPLLNLHFAQKQQTRLRLEKFRERKAAAN